ncbi:unnamed protein product [Mycetohabitans rhizoxinica HKI 454]|uniref:Uncharacterized protein n=1 Tax=Mycetohabitans rhizoxinica (strain DSM 19002 / CIP 109453 / HKI 454) TaxID=882378 RepID=E5AKU4_MYCRK|nr:unnamed protein product [Mycetohabitans rhizoxinica HKI 454]
MAFFDRGVARQLTDHASGLTLLAPGVPRHRINP